MKAKVDHANGSDGGPKVERFAQLFAMCQRRVFLYALKLVHNAADAETLGRSVQGPVPHPPYVVGLHRADIRRGGGRMSLATDQFDELGWLTAALCDGEITPVEAMRLEQLAHESPRAREFFVGYLELHGALYWNNADSAGRDTPAELESISPVPYFGGEPAEAPPRRDFGVWGGRYTPK